MKGEALAAGLLLATLAFALAFVTRRIAVAAVGLATVIMVSVAFVGTAGEGSNVLFAACWLTLIVLALSVYWPGRAQRHAWLPFVGAAVAATIAGLLFASGNAWLSLPMAVGLAAATAGAGIVVSRGWSIALRVVTSWLLAVALLVGAIPHLVVHPGYEPDHRQ